MKFIRLLFVIPIILVTISIMSFTPSSVFAGSIDSPLKQFAMGAAAEDVMCKGDLQLMIRSSGNPACVKPESATRLADAGWGTIVEPMKKMDRASRSRHDDESRAIKRSRNETDRRN